MPVIEPLQLDPLALSGTETGANAPPEPELMVAWRLVTSLPLAATDNRTSLWPTGGGGASPTQAAAASVSRHVQALTPRMRLRRRAVPPAITGELVADISSNLGWIGARQL
jgi:hypothetical protein